MDTKVTACFPAQAGSVAGYDTIYILPTHRTLAIAETHMEWYEKRVWSHYFAFR